MEMLIGLGMFVSLLVVLTLGVPIAYSLLFVGIGTLLVVSGDISSLGIVANTYWSSVTNVTLTSLPLFMLMGAIISASGMGARLYNSLATILHGIPGGLGVATTIACTIMATVSGSSVATAAALGGFAISEMRRHGYPDAEACGAVAAGGTLGILVPPSIPLIVYSVISEQSIGKLFMASIVPGLIMAMSFAVYQVAMSLRRGKPAVVGTEQKRTVTAMERLAAVKTIGPFVVLISIILGSLYLGLATPPEAAALGTVVSLLLSGIIYRDMTWDKFRTILLGTAQGSVMILVVIAGAIVFGYVMTTTQVATALSSSVAHAHFSPWVVFIFINLLLLFLGCFMETIAIIVITMPILIP
ncbi:TRAP transporter large permease subunit, partial [Glaciimonas sp. CA11.2]